MKTRGLSKIVLLSLVMVGFTSCKEEEFYEKEYIDTLAEQYERENLPDDVAELAWEDPDNNPDLDDYDPTLPTGGNGEDDSVTPGTDDSSSDSGSSDDGSSDSGSSDDGSSDSGSSDDGSSDSGSSDDGSSDSGSSDNGSSDSGSSDNGSSDSGSSDNGSSDSGSSDNGSSDSGSSDDGTTPDNGNSGPSTPNFDLIVDNFTVQSSGNKMDVLWVIDNSGSMGDEQKALGENFDAFIKEFVNKDIDFQMAVTTTDTSRNNAGRAYRDSMDRLTSANLAKNKDKFMSDFAELVKVGINGSGYEKGIKASEKFSNRYSSSAGRNAWLRDDAYFIIVYVSDEEDQSPKSVPSHLKQIAKWKNNGGLIKAFSIVDMVPTRRQGAIIRGYERYNEMSELTGGEVASIKSDFHETLLKMGENIANLSLKYPLSNVPFSEENIEVLVNGEVNDAWSYDPSTNTIIFDEQNAPSAGSEISVRFEVAK